MEATFRRYPVHQMVRNPEKVDESNSEFIIQAPSQTCQFERGSCIMGGLLWVVLFSVSVEVSSVRDMLELSVC